ncbi:MAG TPA: type IV-A pilus assembly ATPase PilB [Burkholderiales bacterium]|nr:type IV-A pilus assembly ATPase PilB [Burkholderiales bacterium]
MARAQATAQSIPSASGLAGLARALVQHGQLEESEAEALARDAHRAGVTFVEQLVKSGRARAADVARFASSTFGYPLLDLAAYDHSYLPRGAIDAKMIQAARVVPLFVRGKHLALAVSDPTRTDVIHDVKFHSGLTVDPVVVEDDKLSLLIEAAARKEEQALDAFIDDHFDFEFTEEEAASETAAGTAEVDDAPVVKFIQKMMVDAIIAGASDIHFEPYEKSYRVRFRVDGELREVASPPLAIREKVSARIKVLSRLDISEKRAPQDGRLKLAVSKSRAIDFRVSTLPTLFGEKICMRILDPSAAMVGIDALGYELEQKQALLEAIGRPHGMVLVTGPTGSGKTVSLYTCLGLLNRPETNISTVEDPVEINLPGVNQANVNDKAGLSFAVALRSFLRQDPDVIMVGEIRDLETADIAVKAAQTGHLVLASLHTNDAPATLARLINMGVAPFNIASSVNLITAQRLARRLCSCKRPADIPVEALLEAGFTEADLEGGWQAYAPTGCEHCNGKGYKGRVGIYQVMPLSEEMRRIIMKGGDAIDVAERARAEGVLDLRQSGLRKVRQGMTSLEEVMACTNE